MRMLFASAAALVACTGTASAGLFFVEMTLNNPSIDPWVSVEFRIIPVEGVDYEPSFSEQVDFSSDVNDFSTSKPFTTITLGEVDGFSSVRYDFASFALMNVGDTESFTLAIELEQFVPFKIQQYFTPIPTPGTGMLVGAALLFGITTRRRRAA
jgi:hypothetical protein